MCADIGGSGSHGYRAGKADKEIAWEDPRAFCCYQRAACVKQEHFEDFLYKTMLVFGYGETHISRYRMMSRC